MAPHIHMGIDHRIVADFRVFRHISKGQDGHIFPHLRRRMDEGILADAFFDRLRRTEELQQDSKSRPGILHCKDSLVPFQGSASGNHDGSGMGLSGKFQIGRHRKGNLVCLGFFQAVDPFKDHLGISLKDLSLYNVASSCNVFSISSILSIS